MDGLLDSLGRSEDREDGEATDERFVVGSVGQAPVGISVHVCGDPQRALLGRRSVGCEIPEI